MPAAVLRRHAGQLGKLPDALVQIRDAHDQMIDGDSDAAAGADAHPVKHRIQRNRPRHVVFLMPESTPPSNGQYIGAFLRIRPLSLL